MTSGLSHVVELPRTDEEDEVSLRIGYENDDEPGRIHSITFVVCLLLLQQHHSSVTLHRLRD
jgi:hypothetical protein